MTFRNIWNFNLKSDEYVVNKIIWKTKYILFQVSPNTKHACFSITNGASHPIVACISIRAL